MNTIISAASVLALATAATAGPIIDFETYDDLTPLENGRQLTSVAGLYEQGLFTISGSADGTNGGARVAIFDSSNPGPNNPGPDPDLLVGLGNILIVQNDGGGSLTQGTSGIYDTPNDDAGGGTIVFDFTNPSELQSVDLIDINGDGALTITLLDINNNTRTYSVPDKWTFDISVDGPDGWGTLDLTTLAPQNEEGTGGDATAAQDALFDQTLVTRMTVNFSGSAGIDNLNFVPGPGSFAALAGVGLLGLSRRRR